jgi:uncharacterized protein YjbI with pentapeptide repeats
MANEEQLKILRKGVEAWNRWREENHLNSHVDLSHADLSEAELSEMNLSGVNLREADLSEANLVLANLSGSDLYKSNLWKADLQEADLSRTNFYLANLFGTNLYAADLHETDLCFADLERAKINEVDLHCSNLCEAILSDTDLTLTDLSKSILYRANLNGADLEEADLSGADLREAILTNAQLVETNLEMATLTGCRVHGISAWGIRLNGAIQKDLIITPFREPTITVDNLEVAQFIYLLLHNENIRHVIDTITTKVVLILGRFTSEREVVLDAIKEELRKRDYLPILFKFEGPKSRDLTETVSTIAHMARFVIADITDAKSIPAELQSIVPQLPSVPVQPLILNSDYEYALFEHIQKFPWVLETFRYGNQDELIASIDGRVIGPAEAKANEIRSKIKSQE